VPEYGREVHDAMTPSETTSPAPPVDDDRQALAAAVRELRQEVAALRTELAARNCCVHYHWTPAVPAQPYTPPYWQQPYTVTCEAPLTMYFATTGAAAGVPQIQTFNVGGA
jgi:hypothetical protein